MQTIPLIVSHITKLVKSVTTGDHTRFYHYMEIKVYIYYIYTIKSDYFLFADKEKPEIKGSNKLEKLKEEPPVKQ